MTKINKTKARKLFEAKECFWITPCNYNVKFGLLIDPSHFDYDFETLYNTYVYYNCNSHSGYYPSFYIDDMEENNNDKI